MRNSTQKIIMLVALMSLLLSTFSDLDAFSYDEQELYSFFRSIRSETTGLYRSFSHTAPYYDDASSYPRIYFRTTGEGYMDNQAFIYDLSLVAMALVLMKKQNDARELLSLMEDNFSVVRNGRIGLFNSYLINNFDYFFPTKNGKMNLLGMGIDGDRIHVGPNVFIGLACQQYFAGTGSVEFLPFALTMAKWVMGLKHYEFPDGSLGAPSMGFGWGPPWQCVFSMENVVDYYSFIRNFISIYDRGSPKVQQLYIKADISRSVLVKELENLERWIVKVAYNKRGTFNTGAWQRGDQRSVDEYEALDVNTWAIQSILPERLAELGIDPLALCKNIEKTFGVRVKEKKVEFAGFDFTDKRGYLENRSFKTIWWEGTGEMVVVYQMLADYLIKLNRTSEAEEYNKKAGFYLSEMERYIRLIQSEHNGLPYISRRLGEKESAWTFNPWWPLARAAEGKYVICISSTVWRYFGKMKFNLFEITP